MIAHMCSVENWRIVETELGNINKSQIQLYTHRPHAKIQKESTKNLDGDD